jgi:hypothetical protein
LVELAEQTHRHHDLGVLSFVVREKPGECERLRIAGTFTEQTLHVVSNTRRIVEQAGTFG